MAKVFMDLEPFADEAIWIIHQVLPEDREAVLSILFAYQKRAEAVAVARAAGVPLPSSTKAATPSGCRG